jgi:hypothetical protein
MARNVPAQVENLVVHHHHNLLIAHKVDHNAQALAENQAAAVLLQVDLAHVLALAVHLEKMQARKRITRVRKLVAKRSTTCKRQHWEAQLFHVATEIRQFAYVAAHPLQISLKKSAQIPPL